MGNSMGTRDPMSMGLGTKLNPSCVMGFLADKFYVHGHGFALIKRSGFIPVAISTPVVAVRFVLDRPLAHPLCTRVPEPTKKKKMALVRVPAAAATATLPLFFLW